MRIGLIVIFLLFGFWSGFASAATVGLNDVIKTLETPFQPTTQTNRSASPGGISDFSADFFQESHIASIDRIQRGRGQVSFKFLQRRNDRVPQAMFRWEYREPSPQEIVSDGETMWVYLPENRQVIQSDIREVSAQQSDNPVTFLTGLGNLSRDFNIRWAAPNLDAEGNYVLNLQPRRASQLIQELQIVVDRDAVREFVENSTTGERFPILATTVVDPNANRTSIEFRDIKVNRNISDGFFSFIRPAGVEVVRPSELQMGF